MRHRRAAAHRRPPPPVVIDRALRGRLGERGVVLVGMMGAGKSSIGRRLAATLDMPFVDTDREIEAAARMTVREIFESHGEAHFRALEERVVARVLGGAQSVAALGGGAWLSPATRALAGRRTVSIFLDVDIGTLAERVRRRTSRPLADGDAHARLVALDAARRPLYGEADLHVTAGDLPQQATLDLVLAALSGHLPDDGRAP